MFSGILLLPVFGPENVTGQKSCPVIILGSYIHVTLINVIGNFAVSKNGKVN